MRSIQSGEKERTDLSGRSVRGHLVLLCAVKKLAVVAAIIFECKQGIPIISVSYLHDNVKFVR